MLRLAVASFWHVHAIDYAAEANAARDGCIRAVWDDDADRGRSRAAEFGADYCADLDAMLDRDDIDGVIVGTPTSEHRDVIGAVIDAGKHVFTEAALAPTARQSRELRQLADERKVHLAVSMPRLRKGFTIALRQLITDGALGTVTYARSRLVHDGVVSTSEHPAGWLPSGFLDLAQSGGGALIDLGCHPMLLMRVLLGGLPETVDASFGYVTGHEVEDNAVAVLRYSDGRLAVVETGFVDSYAFAVEIHGTKAHARYSLPKGKLELRDVSTGASDDAWRTVEVPADGPTPVERWLAAMVDDARDDENVALATDMAALLEAANVAAREGRTVPLTDLTN